MYINILITYSSNKYVAIKEEDSSGSYDFCYFPIE